MKLHFICFIVLFILIYLISIKLLFGSEGKPVEKELISEIKKVRILRLSLSSGIKNGFNCLYMQEIDLITNTVLLFVHFNHCTIILNDNGTMGHMVISILNRNLNPARISLYGCPLNKLKLKRKRRFTLIVYPMFLMYLLI